MEDNPQPIHFQVREEHLHLGAEKCAEAAFPAPEGVSGKMLQLSPLVQFTFCFQSYPGWIDKDTLSLDLDKLAEVCKTCT